MAGPNPESVIERTWAGLARGFRDIATAAARSLGRAVPEPPLRPSALRALMQECVAARGGEVAARMRAAELGEAYIALDAAGRRQFLTLLAQDFASDERQIRDAVERWLATAGDERRDAEDALRRALQAPRVKLLTQFTSLPSGVKFLVDLRADLLAALEELPALAPVDADLRQLLEGWFDVGFLDVRRITWESPAALLEKLIAYEAVHAIRSWTDLRNRLDSDRRLYALFHPRMPDEPLAFVEVALVDALADSIQALLDESAPRTDPRAARVAIFYSISNTQAGLSGIAFGEWLIKRVVQRLAEELPGIATFATLSPLPGFRRWLAGVDPAAIEAALGIAALAGVRQAGDADLRAALARTLERPDWPADATLCAGLEAPLRQLALAYLTSRRADGQALDAVARFHLRNGARIERLDWLADVSANGLAQSAGLMVNYLYDLGAMEANHEAYLRDGTIALAPALRTVTRGRASRRRMSRSR